MPLPYTTTLLLIGFLLQYAYHDYVSRLVLVLLCAGALLNEIARMLVLRSANKPSQPPNFYTIPPRREPTPFRDENGDI